MLEFCSFTINMRVTINLKTGKSSKITSITMFGNYVIKTFQISNRFPILLKHYCKYLTESSCFYDERIIKKVDLIISTKVDHL